MKELKKVSYEHINYNKLTYVFAKPGFSNAFEIEGSLIITPLYTGKLKVILCHCRGHYALYESGLIS